MRDLAAAVLSYRRSEAKGQRDGEMNPHIPIERQNQTGSAQGENSGVPAPVSVLHGKANEAMAPSSRQAEERNARLRSSPGAGCNHCANALHELANTITAVLMNAQVMEWRLPPYSRLKRPVREIERQAQRSSALLKRLLRQIERTDDATQESCQQVSSWHETMAVVTVREPEVTAEGPEKLPAPVRSPSASGSCFPSENELTRSCDRCTSAFFPKEER